jgi:hypothetical protein
MNLCWQATISGEADRLAASWLNESKPNSETRCDQTDNFRQNVLNRAVSGKQDVTRQVYVAMTGPEHELAVEE